MTTLFRRITLLTFLVFAITSIKARKVENINWNWRFHAGDIVGAELPQTDDSNWQIINIPHDFQISQPWVAPTANEKADFGDAASNVKSRLSSRGFKEMGIGWYRKKITPDASWQGKRVLLDFEGIMLVGDVYLNGERIGGTDYGYVGFDIDITDRLKYGETNVIAVKANTQRPENSRWYTGGGLFRDVHLVITDAKQYFTRHPLYITTPVVSEQKAGVKVQAEIASMLKEKELNVSLQILDPQGHSIINKRLNLPFNRAMKTREYVLDSLTIDRPQLWSCESPSLYTAKIALLHSDGTIADSVSEHFGIRSIEYSPQFGFRLNGKKVLFKGIANHHTLGALGAAAYPRAMEKRIQLLKEFGFNHVRTSHNPYSKSFLDLCDKYGILVVDELYDKWLTKFTGGRTEWVNLWQQDVPEFIKRDRNHPSVVMWSLGNELQTYWNLPYADWGITPYRLQRTLLRRYDTTRPVTVAMHPRGRSLETDSLPAPLAMITDIQSYNYRYMYFPGDSRRFPNMIFYQSEANTSNMGPNYFDMNLDKVIGLAYWGMIDYLGESNGWPAKGWIQGIFDISLRPKPIAYFLRSIFKPEEPLVHIAVREKADNTVWNDVKVGTTTMSDHWNRTAGSLLSLLTYTNADEVELFINGKSFGRKSNNLQDSKVRNRIAWDNVEYQPGYIEAVAYTKGRVVARHKIETTDKAVALRAVCDNTSWKADGEDLQHIRIEAIDRKGRLVQTAHGKVTFSLEGNADIVAVDNGDLYSNELHVGKVRSLHNGTALVILRSQRKGGKVTLTATCDGLKKTSIKMDLHP